MSTSHVYDANNNHMIPVVSTHIGKDTKLENKEKRAELYNNIDVINKFKSMAKSTYNEVRHI